MGIFSHGKKKKEKFKKNLRHFPLPKVNKRWTGAQQDKEVKMSLVAEPTETILNASNERHR